jgi:hypothetical protein
VSTGHLLYGSLGAWYCSIAATFPLPVSIVSQDLDQLGQRRLEVVRQGGALSVEELQGSLCVA